MIAIVTAIAIVNANATAVRTAIATAIAIVSASVTAIAIAGVVAKHLQGRPNYRLSQTCVPKKSMITRCPTNARRSYEHVLAL